MSIMSGKEEETPQEEGKTQRVVRPPPLPLEWTQQGQCDEPPAMPIRYPWQVVDIVKEEDDLIVVGTAGQKITKMGSATETLYDHCSPQLKQLVLRSHMLTKMEGISKFRELELLELYDNQIEALSELDGKTDESGREEEAESGGSGDGPGKTLTTLDMSYNVIRDMKPVSFCPNLKELYLANNKIKTMAGLGGLTQLRKIDLGANRIRIMDSGELSGLQNLEELWIGKNKIECIQGLENLTKLRRLDVQSNRLTTIDNLQSQVETLEELYLAHNAITNEGASQSPTGLALQFTQLSTLDLSRNRITNTKPFAHLEALEELWLSGNKVTTFEDIEPLHKLGTADNACLDGIYLEYNPVADDFEYRKKLIEIIPCLKQIDATMVGGLAAHGIAGASGGGRAETLESQLRRYQTEVVEQARKVETTSTTKDNAKEKE